MVFFYDYVYCFASLSYDLSILSTLTTRLTAYPIFPEAGNIYAKALFKFHILPDH